MAASVQINISWIHPRGVEVAPMVASQAQSEGLAVPPGVGLPFYVGVGGAVGTPFKRKKYHKLEKRKKLFNRHQAKVRALGERGGPLRSKDGTSYGRPAAHTAA